MGSRSPGFGESGNEKGRPEGRPNCSIVVCQRRRSHSWVTSYAECRMATCLRSILSGGVFGSSGHRIMKSFLSMPVTIASHQPFAEPSFSQYFATTWEPTRNASQGFGGAAFSGLPVDAATGFTALAGLPSGAVAWAVAGAEVVAATSVPVGFVVCSTGFGPAAPMLSSLAEALATAPLRAYSSIRR